MKKRKGASATVNKANSVVKSIFIGAGLGVVLWALLLVGVSAVISGFDEPEKFINAAAFLLIALSSFAAGLTSVKLSGMRNILPGFVSGVLLLGFVWALSLALSSDSGTMSLPLKLILVFNFLFFSFLGAVMGRPSAKIRRRTGR